MKKEVKKAFGKKIYLLGKDADGVKYWLEEASWDCDWYYGFGYVETYTNNNNPEKSVDIASHQHFDSLFLKKDIYDSFKNLLVDTTLTDNEIWQLLELMNSFYTLKEYHALIYRGSTNITNNVCSEILKNEKEYNRLKNEVFPKIFNAVYKILGSEEL